MKATSLLAQHLLVRFQIQVQLALLFEMSGAIAASELIHHALTRLIAHPLAQFDHLRKILCLQTKLQPDD